MCVFKVTDEPNNVEPHLINAFNLLKTQPPSIPYRGVCHALASLYISRGNVTKAAFYLTEAQSVVFRHNTLINIGKKLRLVSFGTIFSSKTVSKIMVKFVRLPYSF